MDRLPAGSVEGREGVQVDISFERAERDAYALMKITLRVGEEVNKARKCRACKTPMYNSEGLEGLCPWCYPLVQRWEIPIVTLEPYDALEDELLKGELECQLRP